MAFDLTRAVDRWKQGAGGAQQRYVEGIQTTDSDPVANAIRAQGALVSNFTESVTSGRWARNLGAVGKTGWQQASVAKAANYGVGITAGADKYQTAMQTWGPIIDSVAAAARQMPGGTLSQNLARANFVATQLYNRKRGL